MRVLSASESISPAIQRTKQILFQPFRKGRSWKLAVVAYLSAMGLAFIPYPLLFVAFAKQIPRTSQNMYLGLIFTVLGLFCTAIMFVFFYLGSRLQFVLFAFTLEKSTLIAPLWRRYASRIWPWLGLKLVLSLIVTILFSAPIFYSLRSLIAILFKESVLRSFARLVAGAPSRLRRVEGTCVPVSSRSMSADPLRSSL